MAISFVSQPESVSPVYNEMWYSYSSKKDTKSGFRYVVDVYYAGTSDKIYEARILPDPNDSNRGNFRLDHILKNLLTNSLTIDNTSSHNINNMFVNFDIKIGEEYLYEWSFTEIVDDVDGAILEQDPTSTANTFVVGDYINVVSSPSNSIVDGIRTVLDRTDYTIQINATGTTSATGGKATYSNNTKVTYRDLYTLSSKYAYRGAIPFKDFPNYDEDDYTLTSSLLGKFLTSIPRTGYYCSLNGRLWLNGYSTNLNTNADRVYFENDGGDIFYFETSAFTFRFGAFAVGIGNLPTLTVSSGTAPLIKEDTLYYEVYTATSAGTITSERLRINVDRRCAINDTEILFMDKLGSFVSIAFPLKMEITGSVIKSKYEKILPKNYTTLDAGISTFAIDERRQFKLNTNWLTDGMSQLFTELIASPYTFMLLDGEYYAVDVLDSSYTLQQQKNKHLIRYDLSVQMANKETVNG